MERTFFKCGITPTEDALKHEPISVSAMLGTTIYYKVIADCARVPAPQAVTNKGGAECIYDRYNKSVQGSTMLGNDVVLLRPKGVERLHELYYKKFIYS